MTSDGMEFEIPEELPVLPLRELVVFPYMVFPLFVVRDRSIAAVEDALAGDRLVLLTAQRSPDVESPDPDASAKPASSPSWRTSRLPGPR
jgi:ATP-dependent Lon protease